MPTDTFSATGSEQSWTVPSHVSTVFLQVWGAGDGQSSSGGYAEGDLSVSSGETLYLYVGGAGENDGTGGWPNGGSGTSVSATDGDGYTRTATGYGGGGSTDVRQGGSTQSDIAILAGGGGGRGTVKTSGYIPPDPYNGSGGDGGDTADNGQSLDNVSGGDGGGSGNFSGNTGATASDSTTDELAVASGGAGGGGLNGGNGGGAWVSIAGEDAEAAGGGGGDGTITAAISNGSSTTGGGNQNDGQITISYRPAPPTITAITPDHAANEITVNWDRNDASPDGSWEVYRSTDGSLGTLVYSTTDLSVRSYTDSGLGDAEERYYYTVRRIDPDGASEDQDNAVLNLQRPTNLQVTDVVDDQFSLEWRDNATDEDGYRVYVSRDGGETWANDSGDLPSDTESYQTTNLLDGEQYLIDVEVFTEHVTRRSEEPGTARTAGEYGGTEAGYAQYGGS